MAIDQVLARGREIRGARHEVHVDPGVDAQARGVPRGEDAGERIEIGLPRELTSFTDEMRHHGLSAKSQVLEQGVIAASPDVAARLEIALASPVFRLRRLRFAEGEPMGLQTAYVPMAAVPGIADLPFTDASLYDVFRSRYNLYPASAKETHVAVLVTAEDAALLRTSPGSPGLSAERMTYLSDGKPLEYVKSIMRGDRYKIVLDLVRPPTT